MAAHGFFGRFDGAAAPDATIEHLREFVSGKAEGKTPALPMPPSSCLLSVQVLPEDVLCNQSIMHEGVEMNMMMSSIFEPHYIITTIIGHTATATSRIKTDGK